MPASLRSLVAFLQKRAASRSAPARFEKRGVVYPANLHLPYVSFLDLMPLQTCLGVKRLRHQRGDDSQDWAAGLYSVEFSGRWISYDFAVLHSMAGRFFGIG